MALKWKLFRIACIFQMLAASIYGILSVIYLFNYGDLTELLSIFVYTFIFMLAIFAMSLLNNLPDRPIDGKQKKTFNRLFLLNFLFLAFLFSQVFLNYRLLLSFSTLATIDLLKVPFEALIPLLSSMLILVLQFVLLYGLYELRRHLYANFSNKQFEFEESIEEK